MKIPLQGGREVRVDINPVMWAGIAVGAVGAAGGVAKLLGAFPPKSRFEDLPLGVAIFGAALYSVGRAVQIWRALRSRR